MEIEEDPNLSTLEENSSQKSKQSFSDLDHHEAKKLKRTVKPLPPELEQFPKDKMQTIHCSLEVYKVGDEMVEESLAQYVDVEVIDNNGQPSTKRIDFHKDLNLCQLRRFCRRLGLRHTASSNKHACRKAIAHAILFEKGLSENGLHPRSSEIRARNTLLRLVNVVLGHCFVDRFLAINDLKSRMDHETGQMVKNFWQDAAECYNDFSDNDDGQLHIIDNTNDVDLAVLLAEEEDEINLIDAEHLSPAMLQKKVMTLIKIRRVLKDNMSVSGTHSHTPLNFLDVAINKTKGGRMFHRLGVYYFYIRATEYDELIDATFQPGLCDDHKGSTAPECVLTDSESPDSSGAENPTDSSTSRSAVKVHRQRKVINLVDDEDKQQMASAVMAITAISQNATSMATQMKRANDIEEQKLSMEQLKMKMELAKALGNTGVLEDLMRALTGTASTTADTSRTP
jgi:hypothetical protein